MKVPTYTSVTVVEAAQDQMLPIEFRADLVLELRNAAGELVLAVVIEVQRVTWFPKSPMRRWQRAIRSFRCCRGLSMAMVPMGLRPPSTRGSAGSSARSPSQTCFPDERYAERAAPHIGTAAHCAADLVYPPGHETMFSFGCCGGGCRVSQVGAEAGAVHRACKCGCCCV